MKKYVTVERSNFINFREVTCRSKLSPGYNLIYSSTYEVNQGSRIFESYRIAQKFQGIIRRC